MLIDILIPALIISLVLFLWIAYTRFSGAEFVKMPREARKKMLRMLKLNKGDVFYDLGCGDGQLLMEASPKVRKAVGIEIDLIRFLIAKARTRKMKNVEVIFGDMRKRKLNGAGKVAVFLSKEANEKISGKIPEKALVASYKWPVSGLRLMKRDRKNRIYLLINNKAFKQQAP